MPSQAKWQEKEYREKAITGIKRSNAEGVSKVPSVHFASYPQHGERLSPLKPLTRFPCSSHYEAAQDDHDQEGNDDKDTQGTFEDYRDDQAECEGSG